MVQLSPTFTALFCVVSLALDAFSVGAVPLPFQQKMFTIQGREVSSKHAFQGYRKATPQQIGHRTTLTTVRGSSLASRQAAEVKRDLSARLNDASTMGTKVATPTSGINSASWVVDKDSKDGGIKILTTPADESGEDDEGVSPSSNSTMDELNQQDGLQYQTEPLSLSIASPCNQASKPESRLQAFGGSGDDEYVPDTMPVFDDGMYHPPSLQQDSTVFDVSSPKAFFKVSRGDPLLQVDGERGFFKRSLHHPYQSPERFHKRARTPNSVLSALEALEPNAAKRRTLIIAGDGIDIRLGGIGEDSIRSSGGRGSGPLIQLGIRDDHSHEHMHVHVSGSSNVVFVLNPSAEKEEQQFNGHDKDLLHGVNDRGDNRHTHEHVHRRLAPTTLPMSVVGQLGILQPLSGALGNAGVSQLVANLILAPLNQEVTNGSALFKSDSFAYQDEDNESIANVTGDAPSTSEANSDAFLLAPSTSSDGIKLQMVEMMGPGVQSSNESSWKHVEFQATLTGAHNEPHLYCATVRPPSSLRMELCDDTSTSTTAAVGGGESRVFLYDSSTGEVVPQKKESKAGDSSSVSNTQQSTSLSSKRGTVGAAKLSTESDLPETVKLVFFTSSSKSKSDEEDDADLGPLPTTTAETGEPPLLVSNQGNGNATSNDVGPSTLDPNDQMTIPSL